MSSAGVRYLLLLKKRRKKVRVKTRAPRFRSHGSFARYVLWLLLAALRRAQIPVPVDVAVIAAVSVLLLLVLGELLRRHFHEAALHAEAAVGQVLPAAVADL